MSKERIKMGEDLRTTAIFRVACMKCDRFLDLGYDDVSGIWESQWQLVMSQCHCGTINPIPLEAVYGYLRKLGDEMSLPLVMMDKERVTDITDNT